MPLAPKTFDVHDLGIQWAIPEKDQTDGGRRLKIWSFQGYQ